jgi:GNAT superfamily N-acetyltransferase
MSTLFRHYNHGKDYQRVGQFLIDHYQPGNTDGNWIQPAWEYMHHHPALDRSSLEKIGLWEDTGEIVAVVHYESQLGEAFFQLHPDYHHLCREMLDYAEENLSGWSESNRSNYLYAYLDDDNIQFQELVFSRGYQKDGKNNRPMSRFDIPHPFPSILLPNGFCLKSLADECDWMKVHQVMWRGFNHTGEPPAGENELEDRRKMFDTPSARRDLKVVVEAPNGDFVSFCGMFYEPTNHYAYVEPVATDPAYRRSGLGKAAVLEGIRRCAALGANLAYVGSDQAFYQAIGFKANRTSEAWVKYYP